MKMALEWYCEGCGRDKKIAKVFRRKWFNFKYGKIKDDDFSMEREEKEKKSNRDGEKVNYFKYLGYTKK